MVLLVAPTNWHQYFIKPDTPISGFDSIHVIYSETLNSSHPGRVLNCGDRIGLGNNCGAVWTDRLHSSLSDFRIKITLALSPGIGRVLKSNRFEDEDQPRQQHSCSHRRQSSTPNLLILSCLLGQ